MMSWPRIHDPHGCARENDSYAAMFRVAKQIDAAPRPDAFFWRNPLVGSTTWMSAGFCSSAARVASLLGIPPGFSIRPRQKPAAP